MIKKIIACSAIALALVFSADAEEHWDCYFDVVWLWKYMPDIHNLYHNNRVLYEHFDELVQNYKYAEISYIMCDEDSTPTERCRKMLANCNKHRNMLQKRYDEARRKN